MNKPSSKPIKPTTLLLTIIPFILMGSIILTIYIIDKHYRTPTKTDSSIKVNTKPTNTIDSTLTPSQTQSWLNKEPEKTNDKPIVNETSNPTNTQEKLPTTSNIPISQSAWLPSWAQSTGINSISQPYTQFSYVMPVWYSVNTDGSLINRKPSNYQTLFTLAQNKNFEIVPSIGMFDADILSTILNGNSLDNHVSQIIIELNKYNYAGIDIDYEMTYLKDKDKWEEFIKKLSTSLHDNDKILSVTVLPKWGEDVVYTGLVETREVQDWEYLNTYADQIRIMSYNYTSTSSSIAGPIAPIDWHEDIIQYALTKINRNKIWLGVHLYGYSWNENGFLTSTVAEDIPAILEKATFQQYSDIIEEGYAEYPCGTNNNLSCKIYYQTDQGVEARYKLAQSYGLGGVAYWRLGQDLELLNLTD